MALIIITSLGFLFLTGSFWTVAYLFRRSIEGIEARTREDLARAVRVLIEPPGENLPSPLAIYTDQLGTILGARIVQQFSNSFKGIASGMAKEQEAEALAGIASSGPSWLPFLVNFLPKKFRKSLISTPSFTGQLSLLGAGGNHESAPSTVRERLRGGQT